MVEKEKDYPAFVQMSKMSFKAVTRIVEACQAAGILEAGSSELMAISVWSMVHGFVALMLERQISHKVLERYSVKKLLVNNLNRIALVELKAN